MVSESPVNPTLLASMMLPKKPRCASCSARLFWDFIFKTLSTQSFQVSRPGAELPQRRHGGGENQAGECASCSVVLHH